MEIWILLIKWLENVPLHSQLRKYDNILFLNYFESLLEQWTANGSPKGAVSSHTAELEPEYIRSVNRLALKKRAHMLPSHTYSAPSSKLSIQMRLSCFPEEDCVWVREKGLQYQLMSLQWNWKARVTPVPSPQLLFLLLPLLLLLLSLLLFPPKWQT